jgi:YVTN family beta-propeller protein
VGYQLGVDLGTTFTAAAVNRDGRTEVVTLGTRALQIPSVVYLREDGELLVGEPAERRSVTAPGRIAREFKRRMGDPTPILLGGTPFSAHALTGKLLREVVEVVTAGEGGPPDAIVVTYPANWGEYKKELLEQAIRHADIGSARTAIEPEAAAVFYASTTRVEPGEVIAVYDLGGGTFDATVLRKTPQGFEILGQPMGIEQLGGVDFDEAVFVHVASQLGDVVDRLDPEDQEAVAALARLRRDCVDTKEALSWDTEATIQIALPSTRTEVRLTRAEFEDLIRPVLLDTVEVMGRAQRSADVEPTELKAIVLVGGSSRIPLVAQLLVDAFHCPVAIDVHPKHAVALGAALLPTSPVPSAPRAEEDAVTPAAAPPTEPTAGSTRSRRPVLVGAAIGTIGIIAIGALLLTVGDDGDDARTVATTPPSTPTTVESPVEPTVIDTITLEMGPFQMATGHGSLWITGGDTSDVLLRIDIDTGEIDESIDVPAVPSGIATTSSAVWVTSQGDNSVSRILPDTNEVVATIPVGTKPFGVAATDDGVWVTNEIDGTISVIDPSTNTITATVPVGSAPNGITFAEGSIWVTLLGDDAVARVDPSTNAVVATIPVGGRPFAALGAGGLIWVTGSNDNSLSRIDPATNEVTSKVTLGGTPVGLSLDDTALWVANASGDSTSRVDTETASVTATVLTGDEPFYTAAGGGSIWVANFSGRSVSRVDPGTR